MSLNRWPLRLFRWDGNTGPEAEVKDQTMKLQAANPNREPPDFAMLVLG